jgi:hypothetical protein
MKPRSGSHVVSISVVVGVLAMGCTGQIGGRGSNAASTTGGGGIGSGAGTGAGNAGATGVRTGTAGTSVAVTGTGGTGGAITSEPPDPGRVTIRRLNREEYDNTIRDLLGTNQTPGASTFPDDAPAIGFDNNGDLQTLSPVQFALYQQAAESLAAEVLTVGSAQRAKLVTCAFATDATCARTLIANLGLRAFRRPLTTTEVTGFVNLMATAAMAGATADEQLRTVIEAMLVSPNFLYRTEIDPEPAALTPHMLTPYEIASRLSYMVYRSMPDQPLFDAAAAGMLSQVADVQAQLQRMLADPKGVFAKTFAAQWLGTSVVPTETFDATLFPKFNPSLAASMDAEVKSFVSEFVQKNNPVTQLLTANFSYIDSNLATFYGLPAVSGTGLTRTTLNTPQRGGLLTMAGVLSVTSYPTRTSLVKRGAWVLSQLLCSAAPAPPANVPPFPQGDGAITGTTQKEVLAAHRADPGCAVCHDSLDNVGIALENYDATGAYRTQENGMPIDAGGMFAGLIAAPPGTPATSFTGGQQLASAIAADPRFVPCVAQNALTYSLGRALSRTDQPYLKAITTPPAGGTLGVRDILMNLVASDTFRMRRGDPTTSTGAMP